MSDNQFVQSIEVGKCIDAGFQPAISLVVRLKLSLERMADEFAMNDNLDSLEQELGAEILCAAQELLRSC